MEYRIENESHLDAEQLLMAFKSGAKEVIKKKQHLNKINVFPVADGDTGSNLASLMQAINTTTIGSAKTGREVLERITDAAFMGARGNSGAIFAQYCNGLANTLMDEQPISIDNFVRSANKSVLYAYQSIGTPVEGTMISVIRAWAEAMQDVETTRNGYTDILIYALKKAQEALLKTKSQLKVLRKHNVVDAGAKGFFIFIEGFTHAVSTKEIERYSNEVEDEEILYEDLHIMDESTKYRYCTEVLLEGDNLQSFDIQKKLEGLGDSEVIATTKTKARVHIHSDHPEDVLYQLQKIGKVLEQKADDMFLQKEIKQGPKHKIALVTDSVADIPKDFIFSNQIQVFPMSLMIGEESYLDKVTLQPTLFYKLNRETKDAPSSSQPTQKTIENIFSFLEGYYEHVLVITVSQALSGTYQSIHKIANSYCKPSFVVEVIDSKMNSAAQGLLVMEAANLIAANEDYASIIKRIKALIPATHIYVGVEEIDDMIRSGRIPKTLGKIAKRLRISPIIGLNKSGEGAMVGVSMNSEKSQKTILKKIHKQHKKNRITNYAVVHANTIDKANDLANALTKSIGYPPAYIMDISSVIAMNSGEGAVAAAIIQGDVL